MGFIGVFDSGLGGLTVVRAIREALPREDLVYLGDTARVPYGTRSPQTILRYARSCGRRLEAEGVRLLVVACNTVSAVALDMLRVELDVPVLGVIGPGARAGVAAGRSRRLGVIATHSTVASGAYVREIAAVDSRVEVLARPAPLLVPLVEEGWFDGEVPRLVVRHYVEPLVAGGIGALVLGCTHYPLIAPAIQAELDALSPVPIPVVDSARATAEELRGLVEERFAERSVGTGRLRLLVTDLPGRFGEVASRFLGSALDGVDVEPVDL